METAEALMKLLGGLAVLAIVSAILTWLAQMCMTASLAWQRGKDNTDTFIWFIIAAIIPFLPLIYLGFMIPDEEELDQRKIKARTHIRCTHCGMVVRAGYPVCPYCMEDHPF